MNLRNYFEEELRLLREAIASANANQDPYIDRLLEGVAYLTANIRQRIDDDIPEICESLLLQHCPQLLRPFPAATIMEFKARKGQLQQTYLLPKETRVNSQAIGEAHKTSCQFRTTSELKINPIQLCHLEFIARSSGGTLIQFHLQSDAVPLSKLDLSELRLFLLDTPINALQMHFALTEAVEKIAIEFEHPKTKTPVLLESNVGLQSLPFVMAETLFPSVAQNHLAQQLLHEYFNFREKFFFVKMTGLETVNLSDTCQDLKIQIHTRIPFAEQTWSKTILRLHCVPAINLFSTEAKPIYFNQQKTSYPVWVEEGQEALVYSVDQVTGVDENTGQQTIYTPLQSFMHRKSNGYFVTTQRSSASYYQTTYLSLAGNKQITPQILSLTVTASNGQLPKRYLAAHSIKTAGKNVPAFIECTNLIPATAQFMPPQRENYRLELISHLSCHYQTLSDVALLAQQLRCYDWSERIENQRKIAGIQKISINVVQEIARGSLWPGLEITLLLDESYYISLADMHLFGFVLHHFFSLNAMINIFIITKIICYPSDKEWRWQTWQGEKLPI